MTRARSRLARFRHRKMVAAKKLRKISSEVRSLAEKLKEIA